MTLRTLNFSVGGIAGYRTLFLDLCLQCSISHHGEGEGPSYCLWLPRPSLWADSDMRFLGSARSRTSLHRDWPFQCWESGGCIHSCSEIECHRAGRADGFSSLVSPGILVLVLAVVCRACLTPIRPVFSFLYSEIRQPWYTGRDKMWCSSLGAPNSNGYW